MLGCVHSFRTVIPCTLWFLLTVPDVTSILWHNQPSNILSKGKLLIRLAGKVQHIFFRYLECCFSKLIFWTQFQIFVEFHKWDICVKICTTSAKIIHFMKVNILSSPSVLASLHKEKSCKILKTSKNCEWPYSLLKFWWLFVT